MNKWQFLDFFWNQFDVPAYDENTVPENLDFPYITYESITATFEYPLVITASIWDRSKSWERSAMIADKIAKEVHEMRGSSYEIEEGRVRVFMDDTPFSQRMADDNLDIRHTVINIGIEYMVQY